MAAATNRLLEESIIRNVVGRAKPTQRPFDYLILAPHVVLPPHDGASLRTVELARFLILQGHNVRLVGMHRDFCKLHDFDGEDLAVRERSKLVSAALGLASGCGYHAAKLMTHNWLKRAKAALVIHDSAFVYTHFLLTVPPLKHFLKGRHFIVDTHNFDPEYWQNLTKQSKNPLVRLLGTFTAKRALTALRLLPPGQTLVHVTESDSHKFEMLSPQLRHLVVSNGCTLKPRVNAPDYTGNPKDMYFVGSLNTQMNVDALRFFSRTVWPEISSIARLHVFGRNPGTDVERLCATNGWSLTPNISENELTDRVESMHFAVLPFEYAAGSKLKLLDACARGVPVLTSPEGIRGHTELPTRVQIVQSPEEWRREILKSKCPSPAEIEGLLNYARDFTWENLARQIHEIASGCDS